MDAIHRTCAGAASKRRERARLTQHTKRSVTAPNWDVGDFVLVAQRDSQATNKLSLRWRGPRRVLQVLFNHVYQVEDLESGHQTEVHSSRLRYFHDATLDVSTELLAQIAHNESGYDVRVLKDIRYDAATQQYLVLVAWLGFDTEDDSWEPLSVMNEDVPGKVAQFFQSSSKQSLIAEARITL